MELMALDVALDCGIDDIGGIGYVGGIDGIDIDPARKTLA